MERRYVPLRPSTIRGGGSSSGGGGGDDTPSPSRLPQDRPDVKRRRIGVSVACNACRRKKIRVCPRARRYFTGTWSLLYCASTDTEANHSATESDQPARSAPVKQLAASIAMKEA